MASKDPAAKIDPQLWAGKCLPILDSIDIGGRLTRGDWTVVIFRHDCSACIKELPRYDRAARVSSASGDTRQTALVELPPYGEIVGKIVPTDSPCVLGRLDTSRPWLVTTPLAFDLDDCLVGLRHSAEHNAH